MVESIRDLGVLVTKDLSPSMHVNDVVSKAHKRAGAILRTFVSRDVNLLHTSDLLLNTTALFGHRLLCAISKLSSEYNAVLLNAYLVLEICPTTIV